MNLSLGSHSADDQPRIRMLDELPLQGVVLSDHARSLDWRVRRATFICAAPPELIEDATAKLHALIGGEE